MKWAICLVAMIGLACESAVKQGQSTALSGVDLVRITDDMASRIGSDPRVNLAIANNGALRVVVMPVVNQLQGEIIPRGAAYAFTGRVRALISRHATSRFTWIMNRDAFYDLQKRELDAGPNPDTVQPEYALTATFSSLADEDRKRREQFYVCVFELTNIQTRTLLWSGSYEMKKTVVRDFLD